MGTARAASSNGRMPASCTMHGARPEAVARKLLLMDADRVLYCGRLGRPRERRLGSITLYASPSASITVSAAGHGSMSAPLVVVPAHAPHTVYCSNDWICCLLIEPEYLDLAHWPQAQRLAALVPEQLPWGWLRQLGNALAGDEDGTLSLDRRDAFYAACTLPRRRLDERIHHLVSALRHDASAEWSAAEAARHCGLSLSRFLHLFKAEARASYRHFRIWKRARLMLTHAASHDSLTHIAHSLGYPDSSYFSHSIRQVYGLRPTDILTGSRGIACGPLLPH